MDAAAMVMACEPRSGQRRRRLLVVDDHEIVHLGFRLLFGEQTWVERCLSATTGEQALELAARYEPHIAVVNLSVGSESGADICARLRARSPHTRVLLISGAGRITAGVAKDAGASGLLSRAASAKQIARAVQLVGMGVAVFPPRDEDHGPALSARELEILELVASGATNREIATRLHLSPDTVKDRISAVYRKLCVRNRAAAVQRAQRLGLLA